MKKHVRYAVALAVTCTLSAPVAAEPKLRAPIKPWNVEFDDRHCLASREYGSSQKPLVLAFKPSPVGEIMQVFVAWKDPSGGVVEIPVTMTIENEPKVESRLLAFTSPSTGTRSARINLPLGTFAPMRKATRVALVAESEVNDTFALSDMKALMVQIDRCLADLQKHWNIEEVAAARLRSRAKGNVAKLFRSSDYPDIALGKDAGGTVQLVMLVNEAGKVADCTVTATSNVPVLDAQSCAVVTARAKFTPAIGADGKPAKDSIVTRITWRIP
jgi:TonB family protein